MANGTNATIHSNRVANRCFPLVSLYILKITKDFPNLSLFSIDKEVQKAGIDTMLKIKPKTVIGNFKKETKENGIINKNKINEIVNTKFI